MVKIKNPISKENKKKIKRLLELPKILIKKGIISEADFKDGQ